jgi:hypothetical protein
LTGRNVDGAGPPKYFFSIRLPARRDEKMWFFKPIRRSGAE